MIARPVLSWGARFARWLEMQAQTMPASLAALLLLVFCVQQDVQWPAVVVASMGTRALVPALLCELLSILLAAGGGAA